jgi:hypothetical protein
MGEVEDEVFMDSSRSLYCEIMLLLVMSLWSSISDAYEHQKSNVTIFSMNGQAFKVLCFEDENQLQCLHQPRSSGY